MSPSAGNTLLGPGRMYSFFHPLHTTACQMNKPMAAAAALGHTADHMRTSAVRREPAASSSASRPDSSSVRRSECVDSDSSTSTGMAAYLLAQLGRDLAGEGRDLR